MLVITRRPGESFFIGDEIEIVILEISQAKARVAINAPREVDVVRTELIPATEFEMVEERASDLPGFFGPIDA